MNTHARTHTYTHEHTRTHARTQTHTHTYTQDEDLKFRTVPQLEIFYPNSVKMAREVLHEATGEVLKVCVCVCVAA